MVDALNDDSGYPGQDGDSASSSSATFTPAAASKTLPLVRQIVDELTRLQKSVETHREQLRGIDALSDTIESLSYREEVADVRGSLESDHEQLLACVAELRSFGVEVHDPFDGFVDFPAIMNRRPIRLCWKSADERVEYWHELGQSGRDRKKLDVSIASATAFGVSAIGWSRSC